MSKHDPYFQFPLSCLAFGADYCMRLRHIVNLCLVRVGGQLSSNMTQSQLKDEIEGMPRDALPMGFRLQSQEHREIVKGMKALAVRIGTVADTIRQANILEQHCSRMKLEHGPFPYIRVRNIFLWDVINNKMRYRDFAVLCSVYSIIGAKTYPVRITRKRIIAGALGYKSLSMMTPEVLATREDKAKPLTENQVRRTLDELEHRGFFARIQASARKVYFSHRMSRPQMALRIRENTIKRATKIKKHRQEDQELREKIALSIKAVNQSKGASRIPQSATTASPDSHHEITALIQSSLREASFRETAFKEARVISSPSSVDSPHDSVPDTQSGEAANT